MEQKQTYCKTCKYSLTNYEVNEGHGTCFCCLADQVDEMIEVLDRAEARKRRSPENVEEAK